MIRIVVMGFGAWLVLSGVTCAAISWSWMLRRRGPDGGDDWELTGPQEPTQAQPTQALDTVLRRYPDLVAACRDLPSKMAQSYVAELMPQIVEDYRRIMVAEQLSRTQTPLSSSFRDFRQSQQTGHPEKVGEHSDETNGPPEGKVST